MTYNATANWTQSSSTQGVVGNQAAVAEQDGWQAYYDYAEQLQAAGDHQQASQYYAYAQQLYNAALEREKQASILQTQTHRENNTNRVDSYSKPPEPATQREHETQKTEPPTWEVYYNYAEKLKAAGYLDQAQPYYRQAQQLYNEVEAQKKRQPSPAVAASSHLSGNQSAPAYGTQSYAPTQSRPMTIGGGTLLSGARLPSKDVSRAKRPKRSLKSRLKIWTVTILAVGLLLALSGIVGLFFFYKHQLRQGNPDGAYDDSISGQVKKRTLQPMVEVLKPAFDKTIRLSLAAQPLLYELNLRDSLPENVDAQLLRTGTAPKDNDVKLTAATETNNTVGTTGIVSSVAQVQAPAVDTPPAAASDEQAVDTPEAPPASDKSVVDSDNAPAEEDVAILEENPSSSGDRSRRSGHRRSARSHRRKSHATDATANGSWEGESWGNDSNNTAETEPPALSGNAARTKELDDLLTGKKQKASPSPQADNSAVGGKAGLSRSDVQQGMAQVASAVKRCGQGSGDTITVNITIDKNGRISSAVATGAYAGTTVGNCAERAVKRAGFPAADTSLSVKYPFRL